MRQPPISPHESPKSPREPPPILSQFRLSSCAPHELRLNRDDQRSFVILALALEQVEGPRADAFRLPPVTTDESLLIGERILMISSKCPFSISVTSPNPPKF